MNIVLMLFFLVLISYLFAYSLSKLKIPKVVALLVLGVVIGLPGFREIFIGDHGEIITILGHIGIFSLMFLAGLESSWETLQKEEKDAFYVALFGALVPFALSFAVFSFLGFSLLETLIIAVTMSITAEGTKAQVLLELGKLKTRVGSAILGAGIIDDVFGLIVFTLIMLGAGMLQFHEYFFLGGVLLSFFVGLIVQGFAREHHLTKKTEITLDTIFVPFFFISMGLSFTVDIFSHSLWIVLGAIVVATAGKLFGTMLVRFFTNFSPKQLFLMGWAMNSRGAIELAIALIALNAGFITQNSYSIILMMVLSTTLVFPFVVENLIKKDETIMN